MARWSLAVIALVGCGRVEDHPPPLGDLDAGGVETSLAEASIDTSSGSESGPVVDWPEDVSDSDADGFVEDAADSGDVLDAAATPLTLATTSAGFRDVAAGAGFVFATTFGGEVLRIPKEGGTPVRIASPERPTYVAVDATHVYWTDLRNTSSDPGKIGRVPILGGAEEILATGLGGPNSCTLFGAHVYFAQRDAVNRVPRAGGTIETLATETLPFYVAANSTRVCWIRPGDLTFSIVCRPHSGGTAAVLATESGFPRFLAIDESDAYWVPTEGTVRKVSLAGGTPTTLATSLGECTMAADIELDATHVYWSCGTTVRKVPKAGGPATTLFAESGAAEMGIAIDDAYVYWTSSTTLRKLPK